MPDITPFFVASSFIAGVLMFFAPCTLPLVPAYLAFISGVGESDFYNPAGRRRAERAVFINGLLFVIGFSIIFIAFGMFAGYLGSTLAPYRELILRIGGALVILFGLSILFHFRLPFLSSEHRAAAPAWISVGTPFSSTLLGGFFAFGWTPCIGPILGSILLLASTSGSTLQGALLLALFSAGLALPFLLLAFAFARGSRYIQKVSGVLRSLEVVGGLFLIFIGALFLADQFVLTIRYGYEFFEFLNYEKLIEYL